jgi:hypothetical protein
MAFDRGGRVALGLLSLGSVSLFAADRRGGCGAPAMQERPHKRRGALVKDLQHTLDHIRVSDLQQLLLTGEKRPLAQGQG